MNERSENVARSSNERTRQLATELAAAVFEDENGEGCDLSAGMFGPSVSAWLRKIAGNAREVKELTESLCFEGEKDYQIDQLLDYLHYDPDTRSHPDWVARAQAAEAELAKLKAHGNETFERRLAEACERLRRCAALVAMGGDQSMALAINRHSERLRGDIPAWSERETHKHTDECWEPDSGCDMGRNEAHAQKAKVMHKCKGCGAEGEPGSPDFCSADCFENYSNTLGKGE